jgi:hypothetical protein
MARRTYRDALNDQPLECRLIPFTGDEIRDTSGSQRALTLSSEPHVRWCGRTAGVSPPPTRSVSVAAGKLRVTRRRGT